MPEFFVPDAADGKQAEEIWRATAAFATENLERAVTNRRIYRLSYRHDGSSYEAIVGREDQRERETILCILETDGLYLICTHNRGVRRGLPMLVGGHAVDEIEDFAAES